MGDGQLPPEPQNLAEALAVKSTGQDSGEAWCATGAAGRAFGGAVAAHALIFTMTRLPPGWRAHSLRVDFHAAGDITSPVIYQRAMTQSSRRFASARIDALQADRLIATVLVSAHEPEPGPRRSSRPIAAWSEPHESPAARGFAAPRADADIRIPFDVRRARPNSAPNARGDRCVAFWVRARAPLPEGPGVFDAALAWCSDFSLTRVSALAARSPRKSQLATLNHSIWFHEPINPAEWLLFELSSPSTHGTIAHAEARVFSLTGRLTATVGQTCLVRPC